MRGKAAVGLLLQTGLGFGLTFLGWGFDDIPGFFAHPARAGLMAVGVLGLTWVLASGMEVQVFRRGKRSIGRQRWVLGLVFAIALFLVWFLPYADRRSVLTFAGGRVDVLRYLGLALYAVGNVIAVVAVRTLGRQYSGYVTLQDGHRLVQSGIYGVIRHPIYLRALVVAVAIPLLFRSWLVFPALALVLLFVAQRIRSEESLLAKEFGAEFEEYRKHTRRLIPYIY